MMRKVSNLVLGAAMIGSPADYGTFLAEETEKWARVVKAAGLKPN